MTENGEVCVSNDTEILGTYELKIGRITDSMGVGFNFTAAGEDYLGFYIGFESNYVYVGYHKYIGGESVDTIGVAKYHLTTDTWSYENGYNSSILTIKVDKLQDLGAGYYEFFDEHTEPVNGCYYNSYSNEFFWTNAHVAGFLKPNYTTGSSCSNARVVVLNDSSNSITVQGYPGPHYYWGTNGDSFSVEDHYSKADNVNLTRSGYVLKGWNTKTDGSGTQYTNDQTITLNSNLILYAQWEEVKTYTVTYDANGGVGKPAAQTKTENVDLILSSQIPTKDKHVFVEWNTKADGSGTSYASGAKYTANANVTLYAIWQGVKETYTVTFNANGGTGTMNNQTFVSGVSQKLSVNQFTKANYTFKGWNTKADGSGTKYKDNESIVVTSNMTLYAIWGEQTDNFNIVIDGYKVDLTNKIISVPLGTTESQFISNISYDTSIFYHKVDTKLVAGDRLLYTDAKFKIYELRGTSNAIEEYTIAVLGDVNGDGELSTMDYVLVYNHLDNSSKLFGIYTYAADMYSDDDITTMDYVMIYNALGGN